MKSQSSPPKRPRECSDRLVADSGIQGRSEISRLLAAYGYRPTKAYGQNFLVDPNIVRRLVALADLDAGSNVVEIGAGTGTITAALAERAGRVVAYEIDTSLAPILAETIGGLGHVELRFEDAARLDLGAAIGEGPWTLVANLPYNVGTGIVLDALKGAPEIERIVVVIQREVADRMLAGAGSKTYGLPSVTVGLHAAGRFAFEVPSHVFEPPPRVDSAVIVLDRVDAPVEAPRAIELAAVAFGQRRKMLRRSLSSVLHAPELVLLAADIDPTARPEELDPLDFVAIAVAEERGR